MIGGRIVVAMSGGVDSSVTAALLRREGWDVLGVTLRLLNCDDPGGARLCCGVDAEAQARGAAERIGIPHCVLDASATFQTQVLEPAWDEYAAGRTPSPCPRCNRALKLGLLLDHARACGAVGVATGHYARRLDGPDGPALLRGLDPRKDQSYFLFALGRERLAGAFFPLGGMRKPEVRALARELGLPSAQRPSSQDACLGGGDACFAELLRERMGDPPLEGAILDDDGRVLGRHRGIHRFTVGQRRGLGVALGRPAWVWRIDPADGSVHLSARPERLLAQGLTARDATWLSEPPVPGVERSCQVQVRYRAAPAEGWLRAGADGRVELRFAEPQRAVTPGQAAVFYDGERVLGGAWIERAAPWGG